MKHIEYNLTRKLQDVLTNTEILFGFPKAVWHENQARNRERERREGHGEAAREDRRETDT